MEGLFVASSIVFDLFENSGSNAISLCLKACHMQMSVDFPENGRTAAGKAIVSEALARANVRFVSIPLPVASKVHVHT